MTEPEVAAGSQGSVAAGPKVDTGSNGSMSAGGKGGWFLKKKSSARG